MNIKLQHFWTKIIRKLGRKRISKDEKEMILALASQSSYEIAEKALHQLDLLVERNKIVNKQSKELLAEAYAIVAMIEKSRQG